MIVAKDDAGKIWQSVYLLGWALYSRYLVEAEKPSLIPDNQRELLGDVLDFDAVERSEREDLRNRLYRLHMTLRDFRGGPVEAACSKKQVECCTPYSLDLHVYHLDLVPLMWYRLDRKGCADTAFEDLPISSPAFSIHDAAVLFDLFMAIMIPMEEDKGWLHVSNFEIGCLIARDRVLGMAAEPPSKKPVGRRGRSSKNQHHLDAIEPTYRRLIEEGSSAYGAAGEALKQHGICIKPYGPDATKADFIAASEDSALKSIIAAMKKCGPISKS